MATAYPDGTFHRVVHLARINMKPAAPRAPLRFQLWIDGVGGYLVCLGDTVRLGQAVPENDVEVPLLADVSRHHATIARDPEGYVVHPMRLVKVGGRVITTPRVLSDGDLIELDAVQLRFVKPHALSATARLEFVSRHHTRPTTDGVVLMADTCVLGPQRSAHIVCRDWQKEAVLYKRGHNLQLLAEGKIVVDGRGQRSPAPLTTTSRVSGEFFSLSLEEL